jgi:hypothetical protein
MLPLHQLATQHATAAQHATLTANQERLDFVTMAAPVVMEKSLLGAVAVAAGHANRGH